MRGGMVRRPGKVGSMAKPMPTACPAIALGRNLLRWTGRSLAEGGAAAWTFLIRTPEMVEAGVRSVLAERLGPGTVRKEGRQLVGSTLTFNPDLVFGGPAVAVGDVKYKLAGGDWDRSDLYQVVAFATAFRVDEDCCSGSGVRR